MARIAAYGYGGEAAVSAGAEATASYIRDSFETLARVKKARRG